MATIKIEGQEIPLADDIANDDEKLRRVLAPFYPETANATFGRETKDGNLVVTVTKRAGRLGLNPLAALQAAPRSINPAVELYQQLSQDENLTPEKIAALSDTIQIACQIGYEEIEAVGKAYKRLTEARPRSSASLPMGF